MSKQSGAELKKLDLDSLAEIHEDEIEYMYQQAVKYQHRVETNILPLSEQTKAIMFQHLREFHDCCDVFRGRWLTLSEKVKDERERAKKARQARERYGAKKHGRN